MTKDINWENIPCVDETIEDEAPYRDACRKQVVTGLCVWATFERAPIEDATISGEVIDGQA